MKLTAVILTKNEEENIERCLKSVDFCDEVIIVDDFSEDKTLAQIHKVHKVYKVIQRRLDGNFAEQRNFAMEKAKNEWVLFLDADEEVSDELKKEIKKTIHRNFQFPPDSIGIQTNSKSKNQISKSKETAAYYIKRRDFWWGRELRYGEVRKIRQTGLIRLVRKGSGYWVGKVHEEYKVKNEKFPPSLKLRRTSKIGSLESYLNHYPHPKVKDFLEEINFYSTLRAKELFDQRKKTNILEIVLYPLGKFLLTYFIKLGFLDGPTGFAYAFFMSFHSFLVRAKLYQYTRMNTDKNTKKH